MKTSGKTQDEVMDNLLRAYQAQQSGPRQVCEEFDPDLANAYVERKLAAVERSRYELHLSACTPCRKTVTGLARMAHTEPVQLVELNPVASSTSWIKRTLGFLAAPQWAIAAAAAVVLAVSIPILLARKDARPGQPVSSTEIAQSQPSAPKAADIAQPDSTASNVGPVSASADSDGAQQPPSSSPVAGPAASPDSDKESQATATRQQSAQPSQIAAGQAAGAVDQLTEKREDRAAPPVTANENGSRPAEQPAAIAARDAAPQSGRAEAELRKIDPEEAKTLAKEKDSADMKVLKPGQSGADDKRQSPEVAIRPDTAPPPPSPKSRARGGLSRSSASSMVQGGSLTDAVRAPARGERKINNKKFFLRGDFWTDKDFNPDKDMPVVQIVRDSENYKEQLEKHSGLKPYFTGFGENARVIVVYKGIIYKLVPPDGN